MSLTQKSLEDLPDLSQDTIEADWQRFKREYPLQMDVTELPGRLALMKARDRALGWTLNYITTDLVDGDDVPLATLEQVFEEKKKW